MWPHVLFIPQLGLSLSDAQFVTLLRHTRTEIYPVQDFPVRGVDPLHLIVMGVFQFSPSKLCIVCQPGKKMEWFFKSSVLWI